MESIGRGQEKSSDILTGVGWEALHCMAERGIYDFGGRLYGWSETKNGRIECGAEGAWTKREKGA